MLFLGKGRSEIFDFTLIIFNAPHKRCIFFEFFGNNACMRAFKLLNKYQTSLLIAFVISSILLILSEMSAIISLKISAKPQSLFENLSELFSCLVPFVICFFLTLIMSRGKRGFKAFWSAVCLSVFFTCFSSVSKADGAIFCAFLISLICIYLFDSCEVWVSLILSAFASAVLGILFGYLNDFALNFYMWIARLMGQRGILSSLFFSAVKPFLSLLDINSFGELFFHKSSGGSFFIGDNIVTGAKDLFIAGYEGKSISGFLSGHFYFLFSLCGVSASLSSELKNAQKIALVCTAVASVLSGNTTLILLFIFFESPLLFLSSVFFSVLSYLTSYLLDLSIGYELNGGFVEMLLNLNNPVYLFAGSAVFVCIGYFTAKYSIEKHGISDSLNTYIPTRLNKTVDALGSITNIIRFKNDCIEVRNPKLVNQLMLDCEIDSNVVKSNDEDFLALKEYL